MILGDNRTVPRSPLDKRRCHSPRIGVTFRPCLPTLEARPTVPYSLSRKAPRRRERTRSGQERVKHQAVERNDGTHGGDSSSSRLLM